MTTRDFVDRLLALTFSGGVPDVVDALVDRRLAAKHLIDFKLGPIAPLGADRPVRVAVSDRGEGEAWRSKVVGAFEHPALAAFLDSMPARARRMIDTDGETAVVYLDDLQNVGATDAGDVLMCRTLDLPNGESGRITRHEVPPRERLTGVLGERLDQLLGLGATGLWGVRWRGNVPTGVLWVTESRWRGNSAETTAIAGAIGSHPLWVALTDLARTSGLVAYADALEVRDDGSCDLTLGFVPR
jgi:hypothetical protein